MSQGRTILAQKGAEKAIKIPVLFDNLGNESTSNQTILKLNDFSHKHSAPCALIIPGIEGMVGNNFFNLAKTLKMEVFALQLSITSSEPDILAIANEVFESTVRLCKAYNTFFLIGYSFGGLVAIELVKRLERVQMEGHLVLLDSAPLFCKESVKEQIRSMDPAYLNFLENKHQMLVLASIMQIVSPAESLQLKKAVVECSSWEECIDTLVDYADNQLPYSNFYLNNFINTMARRTMMIRDLNLDEVSVIKTPISLIRPKKAVVANIDENYDLARYTTGRFTMNYVDGDHISIINSTELSEIIMKIYAATHKKKTY